MSNLAGSVGHKRFANRRLGHKPAWLCSINRSDKPCKATRVKIRQEKGCSKPRSACRVPQPHRELLSETVFEPVARCVRTASWSSARWGEEHKEAFARSGGIGFGDFCRNTILSGTKLGALQCARRAEARDGFGQKSPRVVAPAHPCARDIRTSMCSTGQREQPASSF